MRRLLSLVLVAAFLLPTAVRGQTFSQLFIFGDSISDAGNILTASLNTIPAPPYFEGRFSNGPNYADILAERLSLAPLVPSLLGGTNYAWGGAWAGADTRQSILAIPGVLSQTQQFVDNLAGSSADAEALYIILAGGNDVDVAIVDGLDADSGAERMDAAAAGLVGAAQLLLDNGAVHVLVLDTPDVSLTPRHFGSATARDLSARINQGLAQGLAGLAVQRITNTLDPVIIADFAVVNEACLGAGMIEGVCDNPDEYFFFDALHPTTAAHATLVDRVLQALDSNTAIEVLSWAQLKATLMR